MNIFKKSPEGWNVSVQTGVEETIDGTPDFFFAMCLLRTKFKG
jgi:hypothetical protein